MCDLEVVLTVTLMRVREERLCVCLREERLCVSGWFVDMLSLCA